MNAAFAPILRAGCAAVVLTALSMRADPPQFDPGTMAPPADANKSFSFGPQVEKGASGFSNANSSFSKNFETKSADGILGHSASIGDKKFDPPSVTSMNKSYSTKGFTLPPSFNGFDSSTSVPMKSSAYASQNAIGFNKAIDMPTYTGPEASRIKNDMKQIDQMLGGTKELPNRSLTVQEVRDLLNHNAAPQKDAPAPEPVKRTAAPAAPAQK